MAPKFWALRDYQSAPPAAWPRPATTVPHDLRPSNQLDARKLIAIVIEAIAGRRPVAQLRALLSFEALTEVSRYLSRGQGALLRTVHTCQISTHIAEISGTIHQQNRVRALAARAELWSGRWMCTRFHLLP